MKNIDDSKQDEWGDIMTWKETLKENMDNGLCKSTNDIATFAKEHDLPITKVYGYIFDEYTHTKPSQCAGCKNTYPTCALCIRNKKIKDRYESE